MCFTIDQNHPEAKIAEEDIVCYKLFNSAGRTSFSENKNFLFSICKGFKYKKGARYDDCKIDPIGRINGIIEEGIHSYCKPATVCESPYKYLESIPTFNKWIDSVQVKCIIPKGTVYYLNEVWDSSTSTANLATYVSESIIIGKDEDITHLPINL